MKKLLYYTNHPHEVFAIAAVHQYLVDFPTDEDLKRTNFNFESYHYSFIKHFKGCFIVAMA